MNMLESLVLLARMAALVSSPPEFPALAAFPVFEPKPRDFIQDRLDWGHD